MKLKSLAILMLFAFPLIITAQGGEEAEQVVEPEPREAVADYEGDERLREIQESDYEPYAFEITEETAEMSAGVSEAMVLFIPNGSRGDVEKEWKAFLKPFGGKVKMSRGEVVSMGTEISDLSNKSVDIFSTIEKGDRGVSLVSLFFLGNDFVTYEDNPKVYEQAARLLKEFGHEYHKHLVSEELKDEEKAMKKLQTEGEKLIKENDNLHKAIAKYKRLITNLFTFVE